MHKDIFNLLPLLSVGLPALLALAFPLFMSWLTRQRVIDDVHDMGGSIISVRKMKAGAGQWSAGQRTYYEVTYRNRYERIGVRHCVAGWFTGVKWVRHDIDSDLQEPDDEEGQLA